MESEGAAFTIRMCFLFSSFRAFFVFCSAPPFFVALDSVSSIVPILLLKLRSRVSDQFPTPLSCSRLSYRVCFRCFDNSLYQPNQSVYLISLFCGALFLQLLTLCTAVDAFETFSVENHLCTLRVIYI